MQTTQTTPPVTARLFSREIANELAKITGSGWHYDPVRVHDENGEIHRVYASWVEAADCVQPVRLTHYWDAEPIRRWQIERGDEYSDHPIGPYVGWPVTSLSRAIYQSLIKATQGRPFGRKEEVIPW